LDVELNPRADRNRQKKIVNLFSAWILKKNLKNLFSMVDKL